MWCAAELSGDHGVLRQRLRRIEPAELLRSAPYCGELLAAHEPSAGYVAVGIALPHADKDLAVLKQFEPPVGHGRSAQKRAKRTQLGTFEPRSLHDTGGAYAPIIWWRHYGDHRLAPLRRSSAGAYAPIINWLLYGDP
jgi:hypothetical protein